MKVSDAKMFKKNILHLRSYEYYIAIMYRYAWMYFVHFHESAIVNHYKKID